MALTIRITPGREFSKTVALTGRLDNDTAPLLEKEMATALAGNVMAVVFDLAGLEYISSAGLRVVFQARRTVKARGGDLALLNPQPAVRKVFEIVKTVEVDKVFASVQELDAYLDAIQKKVRGTN